MATFYFNDVIALSDDSKAPVIIKDNFLKDGAAELFEECIRLQAAEVLQTPGMGKSKELWKNEAIRGDKTCWITPELCSRLNLVAFRKVVTRLIKSTSIFRETLKLKPDYSLQFAVYPGSGCGYVRHRDTHVPLPAQCQPGSTFTGRKLTCIYYLNKEPLGGNLRVFLNCSDPCRPALQDSFDIEPIFDRLVVLRSDLVEHEVLPCHSSRMALTLWISGEIPIPAAPMPGIPMPGIEASSVAPQKDLSGSAFPGTRGPDVAGNKSSVHLRPLCCRGFPPRSYSIFVSIAAFQDSEVIPTLESLFRNARQPQSVFVGILWQGDNSMASEASTLLLNISKSFDAGGVDVDLSNHMRFVCMDAAQAKGPCVARHIAASLWRGERYYLQVDSHMRFRGSWDSYLVGLIEDTRARGCALGVTIKPILTAYPLGYELPNVIPDDVSPTVLVPTHFDVDGMLRQSGRRIRVLCESLRATDSTCPVEDSAVPPCALPCPLWAAGFSFSDASLLQEVPYDPMAEHLFFGEEISMAARFFTHGYDFFAPPEAVVYHLWSRNHRQQQIPRNEDVIESKIRSQCRVRSMLGMTSPSVESPELESRNVNVTVEPSHFGLGKVRTLKQFEEDIGVNFRSRIISPGAWDAQLTHHHIKSAFDSFEFLNTTPFEEPAPNMLSLYAQLAALGDSGKQTCQKAQSTVPLIDCDNALGRAAPTSAADGENTRDAGHAFCHGGGTPKLSSLVSVPSEFSPLSLKDKMSVMNLVINYLDK